VADIGKSITIRGDVSGEEDLVFDGTIEGRVDLPGHHLTIGPNASIQAELAARQITINGRVVGNVTASDRAEIHTSGRLEGDVTAPKLVIQEGAQLNGKVRTGAPRKSKETAPERQTSAPASAP
jgi:cytoskeletal protein CcmA (bactofilin family)